jgi:hypothetical protein
MMLSAVKSGTGTAAAIKGYKVAGKTGTAQVQNEDGSLSDDAWFVGFIDDEKHPIAIAVVMEKAGSGGSKAAPEVPGPVKKGDIFCPTVGRRGRACVGRPLKVRGLSPQGFRSPASSAPVQRFSSSQFLTQETINIDRILPQVQFA